MHKILIGGQALMQLGSTRNSEDIDYLVCIENNTETFIHAPNADLINANGHPFFKEIWEIEKENSIASPQSSYCPGNYYEPPELVIDEFYKLSDCKEIEDVPDEVYAFINEHHDGDEQINEDNE